MFAKCVYTSKNRKEGWLSELPKIIFTLTASIRTTVRLASGRFAGDTGLRSYRASMPTTKQKSPGQPLPPQALNIFRGSGGHWPSLTSFKCPFNVLPGALTSHPGTWSGQYQPRANSVPSHVRDYHDWPNHVPSLSWSASLPSSQCIVR